MKINKCRLSTEVCKRNSEETGVRLEVVKQGCIGYWGVRQGCGVGVGEISNYGVGVGISKKIGVGVGVESGFPRNWESESRSESGFSKSY